jgi:amino acid transporter
MNDSIVALGIIMIIGGALLFFGGIDTMNEATTDYVLFEYVDDDMFRTGYFMMIGGLVAGILGVIFFLIGLLTTPARIRQPTKTANSGATISTADSTNDASATATSTTETHCTTRN